MYKRTKAGHEERFLVRHKPSGKFGVDEQELHQVGPVDIANKYSRKTAKRYANNLNYGPDKGDWDVVDHKDFAFHK